MAVDSSVLLQHNRVGRLFELDATREFPFRSARLYGGKVHPTEQGTALLSKNQLGEIILVGMGETTRQITEIYTPSGEWRVAAATIDRHLNDAREKLNVRTRGALLPRALALGLLAVETLSPDKTRRKLQSVLEEDDIALIQDLACGQTTADMGAARVIKEGTIRQSLSRLYAQADVPNAAALVAATVMADLVHPEQLSYVPFAPADGTESQ